MTRAPENLLAVRRLLLEHLNRDPNRVRDEDLEPNEVGIVGDPNHRGGYHCGSDRVVTNDYSVVESPRDRNGLTLDAAALDVGMFEWRDPLGRMHNLQTFSVWCVAQCTANAPDTRDIREIIYSPDGQRVLRWDRLGRRSTGDRSHLWHTHFSFFRDSIKANRDQTPLFRRYLTSIGLITASTGGDDMFCRKGDKGPAVEALQRLLAELGYSPGKIDGEYGPATEAALSAARKAAGNSVTDGSAYTPAAWLTLQTLLARKYAGQRGPAGERGPAGPQGSKGDPGQPNPIDYRQLARAAVDLAAEQRAGNQG
ncbi:hypothetical protein E0H26_11770 [Micromonospora zingiberis]|uniref:Peptidoglycan binding-like domain-containing protein n=1 Tax=Micromonospora zingiberis TaxID=2053011 RepID=A0A4R0GQ05_9ACTN|nr:peptidoglycan-binding protein [Micromonospora zingiberis]TCB97588.1 hypothetical protein E0H26_11770 [Micromonospora zingiberis]